MTKAYIAERLFRNINVRANNGEYVNINLENQTERIVGWLPVFKTKKDLQKALGKKIKSVELNY